MQLTKSVRTIAVAVGTGVVVAGTGGVADAIRVSSSSIGRSAPATTTPAVRILTAKRCGHHRHSRVLDVAVGERRRPRDRDADVASPGQIRTQTRETWSTSDLRTTHAARSTSTWFR